MNSAAEADSFIIYEDRQLQDIPDDELIPHCRVLQPLQQPPQERFQPKSTRHKKNDLSRDDRQVQYALETPLSSQKSLPRPAGHRLSPQQLKTLTDFLNEDRSHRDITWQDLREFVPGYVDVGITALKTGMGSLGYRSRRPGKKLMTSERIRKDRIGSEAVLPLQMRRHFTALTKAYGGPRFEMTSPFVNFVTGDNTATASTPGALSVAIGRAPTSSSDLIHQITGYNTSLDLCNAPLKKLFTPSASLWSTGPLGVLIKGRWPLDY
ncbi:uncharacterized protein NECHADRAFT_88398 [Fusarium vanettenii 77-13-4]|uniref:Uncharacterized protein n=1 Tax=Fusarium vanettenii (strain ATCC MYA-4622 / CBS 123669 / FGSC 9596 / NRRL 45880 / 77-13-4) TaxID=660122 RepID=C7ZMB1_FUSV7|nr:uncharacterized protein NECHADRAFT_88398 [Fusarium vanettenii 77-13-4]EEU34885.1 predicted protein [Fusarium vanettenii 77-13-4]